jgi:hypothetical protein
LAVGLIFFAIEVAFLTADLTFVAGFVFAAAFLTIGFDLAANFLLQV